MIKIAMISGKSIMLRLIIAVTVWWVAQSVMNVASKSAMDQSSDKVKISPRTMIRNDMWWIELTFLQQLLGVVIILVLRKPIWPRNAHKNPILITSVANLFGNLTANIASMFVTTSSLAKVLRSLDVIFTFILSLILSPNSKSSTKFNFPTILAVITMVVGAAYTFVFSSSDSTNNIWGLIAIFVSCISFSIRNIYFKKIVYPNETVLQKYMAISTISLAVLFPVFMWKVIFTRSLFVDLFQGGLMSSKTVDIAITLVFHFLYSFASITVLQEIGPMSHAVLNLMRRVAIVLFKILFSYEPSYTLSLSIAIGLLVFLSGVALYYFSKRIKYAPVFALLMLSCILCYFQSGNQYHNLGPESHLLHCPSTPYIASNSSETIFTAWSFSQPIPSSVITNIMKLTQSYPKRNIHVFCGSSECVCELSKVKDITVEFLVASELVKDTPLEQWLARHPLNKVLAGLEFEDHLQIATQLAILWQYGGTYVNPMVTVEDTISLPLCGETGWIANNSTFDISCFSKRNKFIQTLIQDFGYNYMQSLRNRTHFQFDTLRAVRNITSKCHTISQTCPKIIQLSYTRKKRAPSTKHFLLSFNNQPFTQNQSFQGLAISQFLPCTIGDYINNSPTEDQHWNDVVLFTAGWNLSNNFQAGFNSSYAINPIMMTICIDNSSWFQSDIHTHQPFLYHLKEHEPIWCCDNSTMEILKGTQIKSYFSGSLLLMMNKVRSSEKIKLIYLVDIERYIMDMLPLEAHPNSIKILPTKDQPERRTIKRKIKEEFEDAFYIMESCASAKVVVTQNVHLALLCVGMGIPVLLINSRDSTNGLTPLFHTLDMYKMSSKEEARKWLHNFDWNNPPPNPNVNMMMRMRATFWDMIRQNQALYDSAHKFGVIPLHPPPALASEHHELLFHLVFTTSAKSSFGHFGEDRSMKGGFNWRHWRTLESIFHHHPFARVIFHSNTLQQSEFNVLTEAGYRVEVTPYNLEKMLRDSPAHEFIKKIPSASKGRYWYSHLSDLLRLLTLRKWGGIYMDTDVIVVRPVNTLNNVLGYESNSYLNGAFMAFEKDNPYICDCLIELAQIEYRSSDWGAIGPRLLTRIYNRKWRDNPSVVSTLKVSAFYMFHFSLVESQCFGKVSQSLYNSKMKILKEEAYVVHLNSKVTGKSGMNGKLEDGTLCKHILNAFCVFCNRQY